MSDDDTVPSADNGDPGSPRSRRPVSDTHPELFHYTNVRALGGMLDTNTLWATRATHLNDAAEMRLLWPYLVLAFRDGYRPALAGRSVNDPAERVRVDALGGADTVALEEGSKTVAAIRLKLHSDFEDSMGPPYVASFAAHTGQAAQDRYRQEHGMLSQWRGYAGGDGVAVVFDTAGLEALLHHEKDRHDFWTMFVAPVVYDDPGHAAAGLRRLFGDFGRFADLLASDQEQKAEELLNAGGLLGRIAQTAARIKHHAFSEEVEYRIVAIPQLAGQRRRTPAADAPPIKAKPIHHRQSDQGSIPYIKLFDGLGQRLPIARVIVGPSRNQLAVLEEARTLMRKYGYDPDTVRPSEIPYVGSA